MNHKIIKALAQAIAVPKRFHKQTSNFFKRQQRIAELKASNPDGKAISEIKFEANPIGEIS